MATRSQFPIPPGGTSVYAFNVSQAGTVVALACQRSVHGGLHGTNMVLDLNDPNKDQYKQEIIVHLVDW